MDFPTLVGQDWKKDVLIGLVVGFGFVIVNLLSPSIAIGLPNLGLSVSDVGRFLVIGFLAPVIEEFVFRGAILSLLMKLPIKFFNSAFISTILAAGIFSLYHLTAYGGSIASASGAFVGAMLFGIIASILVLTRKNLLVSMIPHAIFNIFLLSKLVVVRT